MRSIVRAALYLPSWTDGVRRLRGPDEDLFTLQAAAIERAVAVRPPREDGVWTIRHVGEAPPNGSWAFPALLGSPARLERSGDGASGLLDAVEASKSGSGPELIVAAETVRAQDEQPSDPPAAPGAGAVALLIDSAGAEEPGIELDRSITAGSAVGFLWEFYHGGRTPRSARWVGDWAASVGTGLRWPAGARPPGEAVPATVSEGAYVPRARYLEGLGSRWRLLADRCSACGETTFPIRARCWKCRRTDRLDPIPMPRDDGTVVAETVIGPGGQPTEFDAQVSASGPYGVVIVELAAGVRGTFQVADATPGELRVGDRVATRLRRLYPMEGEWRYGRKAVPWERARGVSATDLTASAVTKGRRGPSTAAE